MYLTEQFASFIARTTFEDLPGPVIAQAKERVMDTLGSAIAGAVNWEYAQSLSAACRSLGSGSHGVIGSRVKEFPPARAAMLNATLAHSIELDDGHKNAGCHAGAVVVPTALVMGQELGSSGKEILTAVAIGYEVTYRIAAHVNPAQINKGFHPSSNCGVYGAMAAAGKLMGLDAPQLANGLGQAGMLASGTMEATRSGQRSKCIQVGNAAYNGIMVAYLAKTGIEGCLSALEGKDGLFHTQSHGVDVGDVCRGLGTVYTIGDTYNKLYPSCRHAQPGIEGVIDLATEYAIAPEDVEHIHIGTHQVAYDLTGIIQAPKNSGEAKFSPAYSSAVALYEHSFGVAHLTEDCYTDPRYLALAERVTTAVAPEVQALYPKKRGAQVSITLKNGAILKKELYDLKGSPNNPVGWPELSAKFKANAGAILPEQVICCLLAQLEQLETLDEITPVMEALVW